MNREESNDGGAGMTVYVGWSDKQGGLKSSDETGTFDYSFKLKFSRLSIFNQDEYANRLSKAASRWTLFC